MKLIYIFLSLFLFTGVCSAKLGENASQVIMTHPSYKIIGRETIDKRAYVLVFSNGSMEVGVVFLDDKCVEEVVSKTDNTKLNFDEINEYMMSYDFLWTKVSHPDDEQLAVVSGNGKYFALFGPAPYLERRPAFRIFTIEWRNYCKDHAVTLSGVTRT